MQLITVAGPPSSGKTLVMLRVIENLQQRAIKVGVVKIDCLTTDDDKLYAKAGVPVQKALAANICPDHFFVSNLEEMVQWGRRQQLDLLLTESAGLCNRCSPHVKDITAICVIDNLSGINTPKKIGPMLRLADIIVITKGDIVSQAEREVFSARVHSVNPHAAVLQVNGLTGQGAFELATLLTTKHDDLTTVIGRHVRFKLPTAICSYCLGETRIGPNFQMGNVRKAKLDD